MKNMITERIAIVMLDGTIINSVNDPHHTKQFYKSIQTFADVSLKLCEQQQYTKLERLLKVAFKLFKEGNQTVKNAIINVYLFTLSHAMDQQSGVHKSVEPFMPTELRVEYARQHYVSGM